MRERCHWILAVLLTTGTLAGVSAGQSPAAAADDPAANAPVALTGTSDVAIGSIYATVGLDQQALEALTPGALVGDSLIPDSLIDVSGNGYTIRLDRAGLPAETISDSGIVNLSVTVLSADGTKSSSTTASVAAMTDKNGNPYWEDPIVAAGSDPDPDDTLASAKNSGVDATRMRATWMVGSARAKGAMVRAIQRVAAVAADDDDGPSKDDSVDIDGPVVGRETDCVPGQMPWVVRGRTKAVSTTIGTGYPIGAGTSWMTFNSNSSAEYTVTAGVAYKQGSGGFQESGTRSISRGNGFDWDQKGYARAYRVQLKYQLVQLWYGECPDGTPPAQYWEAIGYTGGFGENTNGVERPGWDHCRAVTSDGTWWRDTSGGSAYTYGAGVKFAGVVGVDLSVKRAYNAQSKYAYYMKRGMRVCGSDDEPAVAAKVIQRVAQ